MNISQAIDTCSQYSYYELSIAKKVWILSSDLWKIYLWYRLIFHFDRIINTLVHQNQCSKYLSDEDCFTGDGSDYQGTASTTVSGKTCLNWSDVYSFLPGNNYCRNYFAAYGFTEPVCYMQTGTHYIESCGVPKCGEN